MKTDRTEWVCDRCGEMQTAPTDDLPKGWKAVCLFGEPAGIGYRYWPPQHLCSHCATSLAEWAGGKLIDRMKEQAR